MKKFILLFIIGLFLLGGQTAEAASSISVQLDGKSLSMDADPIIVQGRTMVPLRPIFEELGIALTWNEQQQLVTGVTKGLLIKVPLGKTEAVVNNQTIHLDIPAQIYQGRTMVPLRFIAESLGKEVTWDNKTNTVWIETKVDLDEAKALLLSTINKLYRETDFSQSYDQLKTELSPYFTEGFIDRELKEFFKAAYYGTDWSVLGNVSALETNLRFRVLEHTPTTLTVETVQLATELHYPNYIYYTWIKADDRWLMDEISFKHDVKASIPFDFDLQLIEAAAYIKEYFTYYWQEDVQVTHVKTEAGKNGTYYLFRIKNNNLDHQLAMYTDNGYIADLRWYPESEL